MAITKILARKGSVASGIRYILNPGKTDEQLLTARLNCDPGLEAAQMLQTKRDCQKEHGVQYYHMIQSFRPGEVTPELALQIAKEFAEEYLSEYEVVIATHVDRGHIHSHLILNSVNQVTGRKYESTPQTYYRQIRAISDRLCREHGLSVPEQSNSGHSLSYIEWLRQSKGQPTFRAMLEADLREAIEDANDLGHFYLLMEHKGYEIRHGSRLGFRLRGQERFRCPGRRDARFTEEGIREAIRGNLLEIGAGQKPAVLPRPKYRPYPKRQKHTGFLGLYYHYLYLLGHVERRQYPPRMTPHLRREVMRFERYREQFALLREHGIETPEDLGRFLQETERELAALTRARTILNVRKQKRRALYNALADVEVLAPVEQLCAQGLPGMEAELARYEAATKTLANCGIPREELLAEKAAVYRKAAELNRQIRAIRRQLALCREIQDVWLRMERDIQTIEHRKAVTRDEHRR